MTRAMLALAVLGLGAVFVGATGSALAQSPENCRSKSNGCQVCNITADGTMASCSLPGIACQQMAWHCNDRDPPPPAERPARPRSNRDTPAPIEASN